MSRDRVVFVVVAAALVAFTLWILASGKAPVGESKRVGRAEAETTAVDSKASRISSRKSEPHPETLSAPSSQGRTAGGDTRDPSVEGGGNRPPPEKAYGPQVPRELDAVIAFVERDDSGDVVAVVLRLSELQTLDRPDPVREALGIWLERNPQGARVALLSSHNVGKADPVWARLLPESLPLEGGLLEIELSEPRDVEFLREDGPVVLWLEPDPVEHRPLGEEPSP